MGVLGGIPPALENLRITEPGDIVPRAPTVFQLTNELFPHRGMELNVFDTILVTNQGSAEINSEQCRALTEWVKSGGRLLLSGGVDIEDTLTILPDNTISIQVEQIVQQANWGPAAAWLNVDAGGAAAAPLASLSGAGQAWGPPGFALGTSFKLGNGQIIVLGFSPSHAPWHSGTLGEGLWKKVLTSPATGTLYYAPNLSENILSSLMSLTNELPVAAYPSWRSVGFFLLCFIVLAGPGVYCLLRYLRRPEYTWLAVPLLAVLFTGAVYLVMLKTGGNVLVNIVQVLDTRQNSQPMGYTAMGYFAPTRPDFTAVLDDPNKSVLMSSLWGSSMDNRSEQDPPIYTMTKGSDLRLKFNNNSQWQMRTIAFQNDELAETARGLTAVVEADGNKITAWIYNKTDMQLDHVVMLLNFQYKVVGDLPPGCSAMVEMDITVPRYDSQVQFDSTSQYPSLYKIFMFPDGPADISIQGQAATSPIKRQLEIEEQRQINLVEYSIWHTMYSGQMVIGCPLTVLAWSNSPTGDLGIKELFCQPYYLTMFAFRPEIKVPLGAFSIPAGLIVPNVGDSQLQSSSFNNNLIGLEGGTMEFKFKPDLSDDIIINKINVNFDYFAMTDINKGLGGPHTDYPGTVPEGVLEVYHPGKHIWQSLVGAGSFSLPGDYASSNGEVILHIKGGYPKKGTGFYFVTPTVAYEGNNGGEKI